MNRYAAYPHRIPGGYGFWAMIRLCRDSHPSPVMDIGAKPKVFPTRGDAAEECLKHMVAFMNGHEIRGECFDESTSIKQVRQTKADALFPKLQPIRKNGKVIQVERKRAAA